MENAYGILVIILSSTLAVFLILAIILAILMIRITKRVGKILEKAEGAVNNAEVAVATFKNAAIGKVLVNIADKFINKKGK